MKPERWLAWFPVMLRYGALAGVLYETIFEQFDRPYLLALFGTMLGAGELVQGIRITRNGGRDENAS